MLEISLMYIWILILTVGELCDQQIPFKLLKRICRFYMILFESFVCNIFLLVLFFIWFILIFNNICVICCIYLLLFVCHFSFLHVFLCHFDTSPVHSPITIALRHFIFIVKKYWHGFHELIYVMLQNKYNPVCNSYFFEKKY